VQAIHPMFPVANVEKTAEFYRDQLGFNIDVLWGDPKFYAILNRVGVYIDLIKSDSISGEIGDIGGAYIIVENVDEVYQELKNKDVNILGPPEDKEYPMRDFILLDCDGHRLCIGSPLSTE
jgi:catechol 2,3-dioxygenase-like lactoylglutathione lyase family enzyme